MLDDDAESLCLFNPRLQETGTGDAGVAKEVLDLSGMVGSSSRFVEEEDPEVVTAEMDGSLQPPGPAPMTIQSKCLLVSLRSLVIPPSFCLKYPLPKERMSSEEISVMHYKTAGQP